MITPFTMRAVTRAVLPAVMIAIVATAGCASEGPRLTVVNHDDEDDVTIGVTLPNTVAHRPYSLGGWSMCLDRPGAVSIEKAELIRPEGDIRLAAFSSRLHGDHPFLGSEKKPLTSLGFPAHSPAVTTPCPERGQHPGQWGPTTELGLQYTKDSDATARAEGVRLTYTSAGERRVVDFSLIVELCAPKDTTTTSCKEMYKSLNDSRPAMSPSEGGTPGVPPLPKITK